MAKKEYYPADLAPEELAKRKRQVELANRSVAARERREAERDRRYEKNPS